MCIKSYNTSLYYIQYSYSHVTFEGPSMSWSYCSWIYNYMYLCNQCLSRLTLWVRSMLRRGVLDTTLCDKVCQWLATGRWHTLVSSTNKTDHHDITEILLKVALNFIMLLKGILSIHHLKKCILFETLRKVDHILSC